MSSFAAFLERALADPRVLAAYNARRHAHPYPLPIDGHAYHRRRKARARRTR